MTERRSPTLRRRRLSAALRDKRTATLDETTGKPFTVTGVEKRLGWPQSKLSRMERGEWKLPSARDIRELLDFFNVTDEAERDYFLGLAKDGRQKGWWDDYKGLPLGYWNYISLEAETKRLSGYHPLLIPGLFQTTAYMEGLMAPLGHGRDEIRQLIEVRVNRQEALRAPDALEVVAVLEEGALRRVIGGPEVMAAQIEHVREVAQLPNVMVYVIPFTATTNLAAHSAFTVMEFPLPSDPKAVFLELIGADLFIEKDEDVRKYEEALQKAIGAALDPIRSMDFLGKLI